MRKDSFVLSKLFESYLNAENFIDILIIYRDLCENFNLSPNRGLSFYHRIKTKIKTWKANGLWAKLDKKCSQKIYRGATVCEHINALVVGAGPCGLRTAIELSMLGCQVVVVEKRDKFSRNNVIHLWPFVLHDLKSLGAKKFFAQFCAGTIDHISIRKLQAILLKVALLLGVIVYENVEFVELTEPSIKGKGWQAKFSPPAHPVSQFEFDVLIGAEGKKNLLTGFPRKEFRGKLAIAITANFVNRHTDPENRIEEISGVSSIFNPKFFASLREEKGIDLENVVYYKDDTHYFVMTAKKQSLLDKGVIKQDVSDAVSLLHRENVDNKSLLSYAQEVAEFCTGRALIFDHSTSASLGSVSPNQGYSMTEFAFNHYGAPDVSMFDFTSMFQAENAARFVQRNGSTLLIGLVGDCLLEPFWPLGTGCPRGFLSSYDAAWMVRQWASGKYSPLQVLAERESIYKLLSQTSHENICKNYALYSPDPRTRYPNLDLQLVKPSQIRHLYDSDMENFDASKLVDVPKRNRKSAVLRESQEFMGYAKEPNEFDNIFDAKEFLAKLLTHKSLKSVNGIHNIVALNGNHTTQEPKSTNNHNRPIATNVGFPSDARIKTSLDTQPNDNLVGAKESRPPHKINRLRYFDSPKPPQGIEDQINCVRRRDVSIKGMVDIKKLKRQLSEKEIKFNDEAIANKCDSIYSVERNDYSKRDRIAEMAHLLTLKLSNTYNQPLLSAASSPAHHYKAKLYDDGNVTSKVPDLKCYFCQRPLYVMDITQAENTHFHRECLRCEECGKALTLANYIYCGRFLCKMHGQVRTDQQCELLNGKTRERLFNVRGIVNATKNAWEESTKSCENLSGDKLPKEVRLSSLPPAVIRDKNGMRAKFANRKERLAIDRAKIRQRSPTPGKIKDEIPLRRHSCHEDGWKYMDQDSEPEVSPMSEDVTSPPSSRIVPSLELQLEKTPLLDLKLADERILSLEQAKKLLEMQHSARKMEARNKAKHKTDAELACTPRHHYPSPSADTPQSEEVDSIFFTLPTSTLCTASENSRNDDYGDIVSSPDTEPLNVQISAPLIYTIPQKPARYSMRKSLLRRRLLSRRKSGLNAVNALKTAVYNSKNLTSCLQATKQLMPYKYSPKEDGTGSYRSVKAKMYHSQSHGQETCKPEEIEAKILEQHENKLDSIIERVTEVPPVREECERLPVPHNIAHLPQSNAHPPQSAPLTSMDILKSQARAHILVNVMERIQMDLGFPFSSSGPVDTKFDDGTEIGDADRNLSDEDSDSFEELPLPAPGLEESVVALLLEIVRQSYCESLLHESSKDKEKQSNRLNNLPGVLNGSQHNRFTNILPDLVYPSEYASLAIGNLDVSATLSQRLTHKVRQEAAEIELSQRKLLKTQAKALDTSLSILESKRNRIIKVMTRVSASLSDLSPDLDIAARVLQSNRQRLARELEQVNLGLHEVRTERLRITLQCSQNYVKKQLRQAQAFEGFKTLDEVVEFRIWTRALMEIDERKEFLEKTSPIDKTKIESNVPIFSKNNLHISSKVGIF